MRYTSRSRRGSGWGSRSTASWSRAVTGHAGELGHILVVPDGRQCGCGRRGCLEAYASGNGIAGQGQELVAAGAAPILAAAVPGPGAVTAREVIAAAAAGDAGCEAILAVAVEMLDDALRILQCVLDPEVVVLGGGLMANPAYAARALGVLGTGGPGTGDDLPVRVGTLGDDSVVVGGLHLLATEHHPATDPLEAAI